MKHGRAQDAPESSAQLPLFAVLFHLHQHFAGIEVLCKELLAGHRFREHLPEHRLDIADVRTVIIDLTENALKVDADAVAAVIFSKLRNAADMPAALAALLTGEFHVTHCTSAPFQKALLFHFTIVSGLRTSQVWEYPEANSSEHPGTAAASACHAGTLPLPSAATGAAAAASASPLRRP